MVRVIKNFHEEGSDIFDFPTLETIFQLGQFQVPPANYSDFLIKTVESFVEVLKDHHQVNDLEGIAEKSQARLIEANPDADDQTLGMIHGISNPINLYFHARLNFHKPETEDRVSGKVYQSREFIQDFFNPHHYNNFISFKNYRKEIPSRLKTLKASLDQWYPNGTIPNLDMAPERKENEDIHNLVDGFRFTLQIESIPTRHLDAYVTLRDYGSLGKGPKMEESIHIPAISIEAKTTGGTLALPKKVVNALGKLVHEQYKGLGQIEHRQSYVENRYR
ncbi:MAG: hypothetical protein Q7S27_05510 [Nanoarchaeota archaeon]|nr:hypothetical protein [Nanoarchaeota archaeon]